MRKRTAFYLLLALASDAFAQVAEIKPYTGTGFWSHFKRSYLPRYSPPVDYANSNRLDSLMRAGRIYLSLEDAIALALENSLDIELARYNPKLADSDVLRANAGSLLRGLNSNISQGFSSASSGVLGGANALGSVGSSSNTGSQAGVLSGVSVQLAGSSIPNLDPVFNLFVQRGHNTSPQPSSFVTGTNFLVSQYTVSGYSFSQGFLTGTNVSFTMQNQTLRQNSPNNDFNPSTTANAQIQITQNLLQGFGLAVNKRAIRIARNNRHVADLVFKQQVMVTVANITNLYYDLVTLNENLKVQQQALELNQKLYEDNKRRAALGAIAPIDIVQAEAEMTAAQQQVTDAETLVLQQEMILKNALTRSGVDSLSVVDARIVPTTPIRVPEKDAVQPVQDLVAEALADRPDVEQSRVNLENSKISMQGTRSAALPVLQAFATLQNNALAGDVNSVPFVSATGETSGGQLVRTPGSVNQFFLGGYGTVLSQLFARNFPNYSAGFQLSIPIRNRAAQADLIRDQLNLRQQQIQDRQLQNNVRMNVLNARIAMQQARAAYDTSVKARMLQEQTLNGARRRYQLGTSSFLDVVIVQRDLVTRQQAEVTAMNSYIRAKTNLELVTGEILRDHDVSIEEAYAGVVKRPPSPLPVIENK